MTFDIMSWKILLHHSLNKCVSESEGSGGKAVQDCRVDLLVVLVVVPVGKRQDVQLTHVLRPKDDGQPLVVGDVLHLRDEDPSCLLVQPLVVPVRVEVVQFFSKPEL